MALDLPTQAVQMMVFAIVCLVLLEQSVINAYLFTPLSLLLAVNHALGVKACWFFNFLVQKLSSHQPDKILLSFSN